MEQKSAFSRSLGCSEGRFGVQTWTFEAGFQLEMIFKDIPKVPALIPAQFPYNLEYVRLKLIDNPKYKTHENN